ncbi:hypothetical protein DFJ73DRAFT_927112 [Zopfochytrium polystomum]|nr:hypothetical protein DFJ73DRAFT_927112 [Zopfochytrium polystomum]
MTWPAAGSPRRPNHCASPPPPSRLHLGSAAISTIPTATTTISQSLLAWRTPATPSYSSCFNTTAGRSGGGLHSPVHVQVLPLDHRQPPRPSRSLRFPLLHLPPEVLVAIAALLPPSSQRSLRLASAYVNSAVAPLLWSRPVLPPLVDAADEFELDRHLARNGALVRHLTFPDPCEVDLSTVVRHVPHLASIDLCGVAPHLVRDADLAEVLARCPGLESVGLADCVDLTDAALCALAEYGNAPRLHTLVVDRCSGFTDAGLVPAVSRLPSLRHFSANTLPLATPALTYAIAQCCPLLERFAAADGHAVTDDALQYLARGCPRLSDFDFSRCPDVSEEGLTAFSMAGTSAYESFSEDGIVSNGSKTGGRGFTSVALATSAAATDRSLAALLLHHQAAPFFADCGALGAAAAAPSGSLQSITIAQGSHCSVQSLSLLAFAASRTLTHLDISLVTFTQSTATGSSRATIAHPPSILAAALGSLVNLRHLNVSRIRVRHPPDAGANADDAVTDAVCVAIANGPGGAGGALALLDLSENLRITDVGVAAIATACRRLEDLSVKGCALVSDAAAQMLVAPPALRHLNLGLCGRVTDASVARLLALSAGDGDGGGEGTPGRLSTLKVSGCFNLTDAALMPVVTQLHQQQQQQQQHEQQQQPRPTTSLTQLCFSGCHRLTSRALSSLFRVSPHLTAVNLYSCYGVTDAAVRALVEGCPRLRSLVLSKCPVSDRAAVAIAERCSSLQALYLGFLAPVVVQAPAAAASGGSRLRGLDDGDDADNDGEYYDGDGDGVRSEAAPMDVDDGGGGGEEDEEEEEGEDLRGHRSALFSGGRRRRRLDATCVTDAGVHALLVGCPSLALLDVSRCDALTDAALLAAAATAAAADRRGDRRRPRPPGRLQALLVRACPMVTFRGLSALTRACPRLVRVDATGCARVSREEREALEAVVEGRGG